MQAAVRVDSVAGEPLARKVVARMGFTDLDAEVVASLVRWHLLLADLATIGTTSHPIGLFAPGRF